MISTTFPLPSQETQTFNKYCRISLERRTLNCVVDSDFEYLFKYLFKYLFI